MKPRILFPYRFLHTVTLYVLGVAAVTALHAADDNEPWKWQYQRVPLVGFNLDQAEVVRVTSLASEGKGTLRDALWKKGPRIIVFEVGGVIDLEGKELSLSEPQAVIAGQTAPSPGITLIRGGLRISGSQVLVQHIRVRPGDMGKAKRSGWTPDGIATSGGAYDVWIDHCSATWSVDENLSPTSYDPPDGVPGHRLFVRNCIIAEGLNDSTHEKGPHSKGSLVFGATKQVAFVGNLFSSQVERNPLFQPNTSGVIVNNVIANPGARAIHAGADDTYGDAKAVLSVVGNIVLFGIDSRKDAGVFDGVAEAYFKDNVGYNRDGKAIAELRTPFDTLAEPPIWPEGLELMGEAQTLWHIARFVGARPGERDTTDARIVAQALSGTARIIDSQDEVEGYPSIEPPVVRPLDVPDADRINWLNGLSTEVGVPDLNPRK